MELQVNGQPLTQHAAVSVAELLRNLGYTDSFVAVAVNRTCIRRSDFAAAQLRDGDAVEILAPMAGG